MLKDYLHKLPIGVLKDTIVTDDRVHIPTKVDPIKFYKAMENEINQEEFTLEKAVYIAAREPNQPSMNANTILNNNLKF